MCNGSFNLIYYNIKQNRLILAVDKLGVRPIYYISVNNNSFIKKLTKNGKKKSTGKEKQKMESVKGVNITLGLPIIRTSVDHGTAFEIAGKGIASADAMVLAIEYASKMALHRIEKRKK